MNRHRPWIFFHKSASIKQSDLELNCWKHAFSESFNTYLIDESKSKFGFNKIDSHLFDIINNNIKSKENFLCSFNFGESFFPKDSFNFLKKHGLKRFCVLPPGKILNSIYEEISLGLFDGVFIDSVSDFFNFRSLVQEINPFMNVFVYDNMRISLKQQVGSNWNILYETSENEDVVLKSQLKNFSSLGFECSLESLNEYEPAKPVNGWIVLPQMSKNLSIIKKSVVLCESGESVFVPNEMFNTIKCCIPYKSIKDIKNLSINNNITINKKFKCSDSADFVMKMLSIINGS